MGIFHIDTDILIVGGGAAGCFAAVEIYKKSPGCRVIIMEKAHIERSGCLAMGLNAINAYLHEGQTPDSYVAYVERQFEGIIRKDLVYSIVRGLNDAVKDVEKMGLPIEKNEDGTYKMRGKRSIRIFGERLKPILAEAVQKTPARVFNRVVATNFIYDNTRVCGAFGFGIRDGIFYAIRQKPLLLLPAELRVSINRIMPGRHGIFCGIVPGMQGQDTPWESGSGRK